MVDTLVRAGPEELTTNPAVFAFGDLCNDCLGGEGIAYSIELGDREFFCTGHCAVGVG